MSGSIVAKVGTERYALSIERVSEVLLRVALDAPEGPPYVGSFRHRGALVPVFDPRPHLTGQPVPAAIDDHFVLVEDGAQRLAIVVDRVIDVVTSSEHEDIVVKPLGPVLELVSSVGLRVEAGRTDGQNGMEGMNDARERIAEGWSTHERARLDARATAASSLDCHAACASLEVIEGRIASSWFAIETRFVLGVVAVTSLCRLPHTPRTFAGLLNHRGLSLPVFYLREVLGLATTALPEHTHALILGRDHPELALAMDTIAVLGGPTPRGGPLADWDARQGSEIIAGIRENGVIVLDGEAVLSSEHFYIDVEGVENI